MSFAPNQCRFQWSISWWILLRRNNIFGKKFKVELKFICAEFQIFLTLSKHDITILVIISHGNRSLTSYDTWQNPMRVSLPRLIVRSGKVSKLGDLYLERHLVSSGVDVPVKFQSDAII